MTTCEVDDARRPTTSHALPPSFPPGTPPPIPLGPRPTGHPDTTYLCVLLHKHLDFRVAEAQAVLQLLAGDAWQLWPAIDHPSTPYYYLRVDAQHLTPLLARCMLIKVCTTSATYKPYYI